VELARIDAFIATLGTGTVVYALALWHTNGQQVIGEIPDSFPTLANGSVFGFPLPAIYVLIFSIVLWVVLDYLPVGRWLYAVGANPEAARLNGIPNRFYIALAFVSSGVLTAFTGVVLASRIIDGRGEVEGRGQAFGQAIALKPQGIVINGFDAKELQTLVDQAKLKALLWWVGILPLLPVRSRSPRCSSM
jgi:predicted ABC-type sugar transport system permease subunit